MRVEYVFALPVDRFEAQPRDGFVLYVVMIFDAGYALVIGVDDGLGGRAVFDSLACGQLFDDRAQDVKPHLRFVAGLVGFCGFVSGGR